jgi:hypothetical protein
MLRKLILGPGWKGMLKKKLPEVIERVTASGIVRDPALASAGGSQG